MISSLEVFRRSPLNICLCLLLLLLLAELAKELVGNEFAEVANESVDKGIRDAPDKNTNRDREETEKDRNTPLVPSLSLQLEGIPAEEDN